MKLTKVTINKYKCVETDQSFNVDSDITILVGMNESGKTSVLEAIAKSNYFQKDDTFHFNKTHDYPRKEKKKIDKSGIDPIAITAEYSLDDNILERIASDLGDGVFTQKSITVSSKYSNKRIWNDLGTNYKKFIENQTTALGISSKTLNDKLSNVKNLNDLENVISEYKDETIINGLGTLKKFYENKLGLSTNILDEYIIRVYLIPYLPKYLYYNEYYALPSRISIEKLNEKVLKEEELKTARALFELADINTNEIINADNFEDFKAELEATQATISNELFKYWETNKNLEITFDIDKLTEEVSRDVHDPNSGRTLKVSDIKVIEHVLDIRVKNNRSGVSLPLRNRSKGFIWFFSFLVWFKKIQEDKKSNYILLLDEPGLNLHAAAQANLLNFLNDLSGDYQIIYTTHSPFMIDSSALHKVRTVLETEAGSIISDSIQEKDPNTLFPLQAALGYDIAQNLFISKNNLLIEGVSDLIYLQVMSAILQEGGKMGLDTKIVLVPTGGLDKVSTFISLLRGSSLNIACLLDSFKDAKGKARLDDLVKQKLISDKKVKFYSDFLPNYKTADIEDLFTKADYLKLYNEAFPNKKIKIEDINTGIKPILIQIPEPFNHYLPANRLASKGYGINDFEEETITNFEMVFIEINKLF